MDFTAPHFESPPFLWLTLAVLAALAVLLAFSAHRRRRQLAAFADPSVTGRLLAAHSPARRVIRHALILLAVAFFGLALARPQWGEESEEFDRQGEDTVFVLDTSKSMLVTDVLPNRLERAKLAIQDYLRRHGRGRVGLVVFAGQAFLQCPLTLDYDAFTETLRSADERTIPVPGSDLARALDEAANAFEKGEGRKLMVLLTDGEDLEKAGVKKARELAKEKVTIYTVGVGTEGGGMIEVYDGRGMRTAVTAPNGQPVISQLDKETLKAIAQITGGEYQALGAIGQGMDAVRDAVRTGEKKDAATIVRTRGIDRFQFPLGVAIVALVAESLIGTRRKQPRRQRPQTA